MLIVESRELIAWRKRIGVTQAQVASRAHIDQARVSNAERGAPCRVQTYQRINDALRSLESERQTRSQSLLPSGIKKRRRRS